MPFRIKKDLNQTYKRRNFPMDSLRELFKIGNGPSSSHTMGPEKASKIFKEKNPTCKKFRVELYGSLGATGKGHLTDWIIIETLKPAFSEIVWKADFVHEFHSNGMKLMALDDFDNVVNESLVFSVGGGAIVFYDSLDNNQETSAQPVYNLTTMSDIIAWCKGHNKELWQYVEECEGVEIWDYLKTIWQAMKDSINNGLSTQGLLPGSLKYPRKAKDFYEKNQHKNKEDQFLGKIFAYTLAVSEENGAGGKIVTAPTCGSAGTIPGLLYAMQDEYNLTDDQILKSLAIAGIIGNTIKHNATISGAEGGCQAEIGSACCMAAGMASYLLGGTLGQIEYSAEIALEHNLGLTCDPIGGYVQIPCIERNAIASTRALNTAKYTLFTDGSHRVSLDQVILTMKQTGEDLRTEYKETSLAGLAKILPT